MNTVVTRCPLWVNSGHVQRKRHVRFTPESGHSELVLRCPLCAIGHRYVLTSLQRQRDDRLQQAGAYSGAAMSGNSITTIRCAAPSNYLNAL